MPNNVDFLNWIAEFATGFVSVAALAVSICALQKTRNQRRPYLSLSFDVQSKSLLLTNYGDVPATLNAIDYSEDVERLKATDELFSLLSGKDSGKPFEDLEGTTIGPGLEYSFCIDTNNDDIRNKPFITATLEYAASNRFAIRKSSYKETFRINLRPKQGYPTARYFQRNNKQNKMNS